VDVCGQLLEVVQNCGGVASERGRYGVTRVPEAGRGIRRQSFGVSKSIVSRAIAVITPFISAVAADRVPTADDLDQE
jgi:hypothetical protein